MALPPEMVLQGRCQLHPSEGESFEARCWLMVKEGECRVEDFEHRLLAPRAPKGEVPCLSFAVTDLVFPTQGDVQRTEAFELPRHRVVGGFVRQRSTDSDAARIFDLRKQAAVWHCRWGSPLDLSSNLTVDWDFFWPSPKHRRDTKLVDGSILMAHENGLTLKNCAHFGFVELTALRLAIAAPLSQVARQSGDAITLYPLSVASPDASSSKGSAPK